MERFLYAYHRHCPALLERFDSNEYHIRRCLGEGSFGKVYKAGIIAKSKSVAIKRINISKREMALSAVRESVVLTKLRHANIVNLVKVHTSDHYAEPSIYLVLEYCKYDLATILRDPLPLSQPDMRKLMGQLISAVAFVHENRFLHRDIKPANILVTKFGVVKLADFGLARPFLADPDLTDYNDCSPHVGTLWYQAPELLLGDTRYRSSIDMWSVGCVLAEMWTRKPIFRGNNELSQLLRILDCCGPIDHKTWPGAEYLKGYKALHAMRPPRCLKETFAAAVSDPQALDLLDQLLILDPYARITASAALEHAYLQIGSGVQNAN